MAALAAYLLPVEDEDRPPTPPTPTEAPPAEEETDESECPVCLSSFGASALTVLPCEHVICGGCFAIQDADVDGALRRCPLCRSRFLNAGDAQQVHHRDHDRCEASLAEVAEMMRGDPWMTAMVGVWLTPEAFTTADGEPASAAALEADVAGILQAMTEHDKQATFFRALEIAAMAVPTSFLYLESNPVLRMIRAGVDPSVLSGPPPSFESDHCGSTGLHWLPELVRPSGGDSPKNVVVIARQLLDAGADVDARAEKGMGLITPLVRACSSAVPTNIALIELYLARGADPNAADDSGQTAGMHSTPPRLRA